MKAKVLFDPHPFLEPVCRTLREVHGVECISVESATASPGPPLSRGLWDEALARPVAPRGGAFPSWLRDACTRVEPAFRSRATATASDVQAWLEVLEPVLRSGVSLVLVWNDVTPRAKGLVLLARALGIPSLHVLHFALPIHLNAHDQVSADLTCVPGTSAKQYYVARGTPDSNILVTGNPYWDGWAPCPSAAIRPLREALGLSTDRKVVLFAPTWHHHFESARDPEARVARDLEIVLECLREVAPRIPLELAVKIHPGQEERADAYRRALAQEPFASRVYTEASPLSLQSASDLVMCSGSMLVEAMLLDRPVVFDVCEHYASRRQVDSLFGCHFTIESAPFPIALTPLELLRHVTAALRGERFAPRPRVEAMLHQLNGPCDGRATERVVAAALPLLERSQQRELPPPPVGGPASRSHEQGPTAAPPPVWRQLGEDHDVEIYNEPRPDLIELLARPPRRVLDVGCASGATGALLKETYPAAHVTGIELCTRAIEAARGQLDHVISGNIEQIDLDASGLSRASIDTLILGDVIEHLYDPWHTLERLRPFLTADAQLVASIPNVRNLWLIEELLSGRWTYAEEGLLDITHIRFFTRSEMLALFEQTGYDVEVVERNIDHRVPELPGSVVWGSMTRPDSPALELTQADLDELRTLQFLIRAAPVPRVPRVGYLSMEPDSQACPRIRLYSPLTYLDELGGIEFVDLYDRFDLRWQLSVDRMRTCDVVVVQRQVADSLSCSDLRQLMQRDCSILYELDDLLTHLPDTHNDRAYFSGLRGKLEEFVRAADAVTVSTPRLARQFENLARSVTVVPNAIDLRIWGQEPVPPRPPGPTLRVLFAGTPTHQEDLSLIEDVLVRILNEGGGHVELLLWGNVTEKLSRHPQVQLIDFCPLYVEYARRLRNLPADLAVVPLVENDFNRSKSHIKWLEYSICGIPGVYSNLEAYADHVQHGQTGMLAGPSPEEWYKWTSALIADAQLRDQIARRARDEVLTRHTLEQSTATLLSVLRDERTD